MGPFECLRVVCCPERSDGATVREERQTLKKAPMVPFLDIYLSLFFQSQDIIRAAGVVVA